MKRYITVTTRILTEVAMSVSELKANPMKAVASGHGLAVAVLNRNVPAFYCVPAPAYEELLDRLDDMDLLALAKRLEKEPSVKVNLNDL